MVGSSRPINGSCRIIWAIDLHFCPSYVCTSNLWDPRTGFSLDVDTSYWTNTPGPCGCWLVQYSVTFSATGNSLSLPIMVLVWQPDDAEDDNTIDLA